jgi:hypothetical protein
LRRRARLNQRFPTERSGSKKIDGMWFSSPGRLRLTCVAALCAIAGLLLGEAPAANAATPAYCGGIASDRSVARLPATIVRLDDKAVGPTSARVLRSSAAVLEKAARRARGTTRRRFAAAARRLRAVASAGLTRGHARRLYRDFDALARGAGRRCGLPSLRPRPAPPAGPVARSAVVDETFCQNRSDSRVTIPADFVLGACWDGSAVVLSNTGNFVRQVVIGGAMGPVSRYPLPTASLASLYVGLVSGQDIVPPGFAAKTFAGAKPGFVAVQPAPIGLMRQYSVARYIEGFVGGRVGRAQDIAGLAQALDAALVEAINCAYRASVLDRIACAACFTSKVGRAVVAFAAERSIDLVRDPSLKKIAAPLWGLVEAGSYASDSIVESLERRTSVIDVAAPSSPVPPRPAPDTGKKPDQPAQAPQEQPAKPQPETPPQPPATYRYAVYGTCADGACGLRKRAGPGYTHHAHVGWLYDGNAVDIVCQTTGEFVQPNSGTGSDVWDKLADGTYVTDVYVNTPATGGAFTSSIPRC